MGIVTIIAPSQAVSGVQPVGGQAGTATGAGGAPPVSAGAVIAGVIAGRDAIGNFLLRTPQGVYTIKSATPLTYNSDVTIRIESASASSTSARILTVNGESYASFSAPVPEETDAVASSLEQAPQATQGTATQSVQAQAAQTPGVIRAVVLPSPAASANSALAAGTGVLVRLQQTNATPATTQAQPVEDVPAAVSRLVTPQAQASAASGIPTQGAAAQTQAQGQAAPASLPTGANTGANAIAQAIPATPQTNAPAAPSLSPLPAAEASTATAAPPAAQASYAAYASPPGTATVPHALAAPEPATPAVAAQAYAAGQAAPEQSAPTLPAATPPVPAGATLAQGEVIATAPQGIITVQTPLGELNVQALAGEATSQIAAGTPVTIALPVLQAALTATPAPVAELATSWATLNTIVSLVEEGNPVVAANLMARLPQANANFAATSFPFIAAFAQGDSKKILGEDTINLLRAMGRGELVDRFGAEVNTILQSYAPPAEGQPPRWQMMLLPFAYQESLQQARLFVKRDAPKKDAGKKPPEGTRFIVEVELTELGPMQMDGLVRKNDKSTIFDLVIRSRAGFSGEDQKEMRTMFVGASELTGFKGSLAFQVAHDFPVKPLDEMLTQHQEVLA